MPERYFVPWRNLLLYIGSGILLFALLFALQQACDGKVSSSRSHLLRLNMTARSEALSTPIPGRVHVSVQFMHDHVSCNRFAE